MSRTSRLDKAGGPSALLLRGVHNALSEIEVHQPVPATVPDTSYSQSQSQEDMDL